MKKTQEQVGFDYGYVILDHTPDRITGSIFEIVEAIGLPEKQEDALKKIIRSKFWEIMKDHAIRISPTLHTRIRNKSWENQRMSSNSDIALPSGDVDEI